MQKDTKLPSINLSPSQNYRMQEYENPIKPNKESSFIRNRKKAKSIMITNKFRKRKSIIESCIAQSFRKDQSYAQNNNLINKVSSRKDSANQQYLKRYNTEAIQEIITNNSTELCGNLIKQNIKFNQDPQHKKLSNCHSLLLPRSKPNRKKQIVQTVELQNHQKSPNSHLSNEKTVSSIYNVLAKKMKLQSIRKVTNLYSYKSSSNNSMNVSPEKQKQKSVQTYNFNNKDYSNKFQRYDEHNDICQWENNHENIYNETMNFKGKN